MKSFLAEYINTALKKIGLVITPDITNAIGIEVTKDRSHGDFTSNIALLLAKQTARKPRELADEIIAHLPSHVDIEIIQSAGPGFINFTLYPHAFMPLLKEIFLQKSLYGIAAEPKNISIHLEYVSSNPTGPLHVGHGRGAAYGSTLANLLRAAGYRVYREYYVNDAGRQMDILSASIYLRYLQRCGETLVFPENGYQGAYIKDIAEIFYDRYQTQYLNSAVLIIKEVKNASEADVDKEIYIDKIISRCKKVLGDKAYQLIFNWGLNIILKDIREDLKEFGVDYENFFSERQLWTEKAVEEVIAQLRDKNFLYEKEGALWFRSTDFGDDKDRVVIRENGQYTYLASDIAYHAYKFKHYDQVINVLGADHHGYVPRLKAIVAALGYPVENFYAPLVQFAVLYRGKERVSMSTRSGDFVTLRALREEVGNEAARFFYTMRKADQHLEFDLALATSTSHENPLYYIQYAHARICSIFRQCTEKKLSWDYYAGLKNLERLDHESEKNLLLSLSRYQETILQAAAQFEPHLLTYYLREVSENFHRYYNIFQFLVSDDTVRHARLCLIEAVRQVIANGLMLLGIKPMDSM